MLIYRIFDFLLSSNVSLPELPVVKQGSCSLSFKLFDTPLVADGGFAFSQHWKTAQGQLTMLLGKKKTFTAFEFHTLQILPFLKP